MQHLLEALQSYYSSYQPVTDLSLRRLTFLEFLDRKYREYIFFEFTAPSVSGLLICLQLVTRYPVDVPRTKIYLKGLSTILNNEGVTLYIEGTHKVILQMEVLSDTFEPDMTVVEQLEVIDGVVANLASVLFSTHGVISLCYRLKDKGWQSEYKEKFQKLLPHRLVELTMCSWGQPSIH